MFHNNVLEKMFQQGGQKEINPEDMERDEKSMENDENSKNEFSHLANEKGEISWENIEKYILDVKAKVEKEFEKEPSSEQEKLIALSEEFIDEMVEDFKHKFWEALKEYVDEDSEAGRALAENIKKNNFDLPSFKIMDKKAVEKLYQKYIEEIVEKKRKNGTLESEDKQREDIFKDFQDDKAVFLSLALPEQLGEYWDISSEKYDEKINEVTGLIPWGGVYYDSIWALRDGVNNYNTESKHGYMERVSYIEEHSKSCFYLWSVEE